MKKLSGRFILRRRLGDGTFGVVHLATDELLGREVVTKQLTKFAPEIVARFKREAIAAATLVHRNIVTIYDIVLPPATSVRGSAAEPVRPLATEGTAEPHDQPERPTEPLPGVALREDDEAAPYIVMEYVRGGDLKDWFDRKHKRVRPEEALVLVVQVADALQYAHTLNVIHRDVKPANILIGRDGGDVKLVDFGLAKIAHHGPPLTGATEMLGTLAYSSPQQLTASHEAGPLDDQYSLGIILYELLAGQRPFDGDTPQALIKQIIHDEPREFTDLRGTPHARLEDIVRKCIHREPARRFASCGEVAEVLREHARWREREDAIERVALREREVTEVMRKQLDELGQRAEAAEAAREAMARQLEEERVRVKEAYEAQREALVSKLRHILDMERLPAQQMGSERSD